MTVTRWVNHHPAFIAEMNFLRETQREKQVSIAKRVTEKAILAVEAAIDNDDVDVALKWLRLPPPQGQTDERSRPTDSVEVVENHRKRMPSTLDELMGSTGGERTESEAESDLIERMGS
ncbi:MAG: hypothetical protein IPK93_07415 [Solirubrobacterales bacterium]|nr:hypothetical protein [Solirubrobacterales bacterium]